MQTLSLLASAETVLVRAVQRKPGADGCRTGWGAVTGAEHVGWAGLVPDAGELPAARAALLRCAASAGRVLLSVVVVGLPSRPLEHLQGPPLLAMADSSLLQATA